MFSLFKMMLRLRRLSNGFLIFYLRFENAAKQLFRYVDKSKALHEVMSASLFAIGILDWNIIERAHPESVYDEYESAKSRNLQARRRYCTEFRPRFRRTNAYE